MQSDLPTLMSLPMPVTFWIVCNLPARVVLQCVIVILELGLESSYNRVARINSSVEQLEDQFFQLNSTLEVLSDFLNDFAAMCNGDLLCESTVPSTPLLSSLDGVSRLLCDLP